MFTIFQTCTYSLLSAAIQHVQKAPSLPSTQLIRHEKHLVSGQTIHFILAQTYDNIRADDIRAKHAFVWGDLNARNQPNAFSYGET